MVSVRSILVGLALAGGVTMASAQFFTIKQHEPDFGEGKIPASQAKNFVDQSVTACGRGSNVVEAWHALNIGDPGMYGLVGADLMVFFPADASPLFYYGKVVCVTGVVKLHDLWRAIVPAITVDAQQQITVLSAMPRAPKK